MQQMILREIEPVRSGRRKDHGRRGALALLAASLLGAVVLAGPALSATYYVAAHGSDRQDGLSTARAWRTLDRVNTARLRPGDRVLFRRGDTWRGSLRPQNGAAGYPVIYAAYGAGAKPLFLGSVARNAQQDWRREGGSLWSTGEASGEGMLPVDVGNLIFGNEQACGVKVWTKADLKTQGQFWYDASTRKLYVYSDRNPATRYRRIECALHRHIIDESSAAYVTYANLALKYGGAHGIGGGETHHITVRDCDFAYIGGADQRGDGSRVRYGNGIEFWGNAHDNLVERCRLREIYDAALTNQNSGSVARQYNITYRNNLIWNSEYSFEYWNRPAASETRDIRFIHNTCVNAGHGWGHTQRPDPSGRHLCFYASDAAAHHILIANCIFAEAAGNAFYAPEWPREALTQLTMAGNLWYQRQGVMLLVGGQSYPMRQFEQYRAEWGLDRASLVADPRFQNPGRQDFRLRPGSPCLSAGRKIGLQTDYAGAPRPPAAAPDIGALQSPP